MSKLISGTNCIAATCARHGERHGEGEMRWWDASRGLGRSSLLVAYRRVVCPDLPLCLTRTSQLPHLDFAVRTAGKRRAPIRRKRAAERGSLVTHLRRRHRLQIHPSPRHKIRDSRASLAAQHTPSAGPSRSGQSAKRSVTESLAPSRYTFARNTFADWKVAMGHPAISCASTDLSRTSLDLPEADGPVPAGRDEARSAVVQRHLRDGILRGVRHHQVVVGVRIVRGRSAAAEATAAAEAPKRALAPKRAARAIIERHIS
eukprot:scaffold1228_cov246-Pinguiococcus_pyrenoidosus.AAC.8